MLSPWRIKGKVKIPEARTDIGTFIILILIALVWFLSCFCCLLKESQLFYVGILAGVCTTISSLPQAIKVIKTKSTQDLSLTMYIMLILGLILWLIYGVLIKNIPIIVANIFPLGLDVVILIYKARYG